MAEYCDKCAEKFGFEKETDVLLCEGCGKNFQRVEKDWSKFLKVVLIILALTLIELVFRYFIL